MAKLWYPVALTVTIVGCGGKTDSDDSRPNAGGTTQVDTGSPAQTGGMTPRPPYGPPPAMGGASTGSTGGASYTMGGRSNIDSGTPTATGGRIDITVYGVIGINRLR